MYKENKFKNTHNDMCEIIMECKDCGKQFVVSVSEQLFMKEKGFSTPKRCKECRGHKNDTAKMITCTDCGEQFAFTTREQNYYEQNNLQEPKRCKKCRNARREAMSYGQNISKENK